MEEPGELRERVGSAPVGVRRSGAVSASSEGPAPAETGAAGTGQGGAGGWRSVDFGELEKRSVGIRNAVRQGLGAAIRAPAPSRPRLWHNQTLRVRRFGQEPSSLLLEDADTLVSQMPDPPPPGVSWRRLLAVLCVTVAYISIGAAVFHAIDGPRMAKISAAARGWCMQLAQFCKPALDAVRETPTWRDLNVTQQEALIHALSTGCPTEEPQGGETSTWNCNLPREVLGAVPRSGSDPAEPRGYVARGAQDWEKQEFSTTNPPSYNYCGAWLMSFLMIATIGYEGVRPFSKEAKIYAVFHLAAGVPLYFYLLGVIAKFYERTEFLTRRSRREAARSVGDYLRRICCRSEATLHERPPVSAGPPLLIIFVPGSILAALSILCLLAGIDHVIPRSRDVNEAFVTPKVGFWNSVYASYTSLLTVDAFFEGVLYATPLDNNLSLRWVKAILFFVLITIGMSVLWFLVSVLVFGLDAGFDKTAGMYAQITIGGLESLPSGGGSSGQGMFQASAPSPNEVLNWSMPSPESRPAVPPTPEDVQIKSTRSSERKK